MAHDNAPRDENNNWGLFGIDSSTGERRQVKVTAAGALVVSSSGASTGGAADGSPPSGNPVLVAGMDGTNVQTLLTDTTGRVILVGPAADGAAVTGNPVLIAGQDGTNAQSLLTDTSGRIILIGAAADGAAVTGNPVLIAGQDGTNAQSLRSDTTGNLGVYPKTTSAAFADGVSNTQTIQLNEGGSSYPVWVYPSIFNGTTWDRERSASAANQSATTMTGARLVAPVGNWAVTHTPAGNTQATASKGAGAAGVRHVCTSISASLSGGGTAPAVTTGTLNLRDGATGAGTVLWSSWLTIQAVAGIHVRCDLSNLAIVGSAATAMTLEFAAAGGANTLESVALTGYSVI